AIPSLALRACGVGASDGDARSRRSRSGLGEPRAKVPRLSSPSRPGCVARPGVVELEQTPCPLLPHADRLMGQPATPTRRPIVPLALCLLGLACFAAAYGQAPLYYSNQK